MINVKIKDQEIGPYPWEAETLKAIEERIEEAYKKGYEEGYEEGENAGCYSSDYKKGYADGWAEAVDNAEKCFLHKAVYRVREIMRYQMGAMAENHRRLFDRKYVCPWCGQELDIEYREKEQYVARCECRAVFINATSPREAAEKCVFMLKPLTEYHQDYGPVAGYSRPRIEDDLITIGNPELDTDIEPADFRYWFELPHVTSMPITPKGQ